MASWMCAASYFMPGCAMAGAEIKVLKMNKLSINLENVNIPVIK
jgi:hypothetical protein